MKNAPHLFSPLILPNGTVIPNRLAKASMEENLCDADHAPGLALCQLYRRWADGGAGLILTGNVMVDHRALTGPGGVVLEDDRHIDRFRRWAAAASAGGAQVWMQINHPGRQVMAALGQPAWAPSPVPLQIAGLKGAFAEPREMTPDDIESVIARFVRTAELAHEAGFHGVQVHAAHGYLISQFLSPVSNQRQDGWGGPLPQRARFLLSVVRTIRERLPRRFSVAVKLNSADFQRGGFTLAEARQVLEWLNDLDVDLVELSGGNYESPAMRGLPAEGSTGRREAYFAQFAQELLPAARMPLMVTGGIRRRAVAEEVLGQGIAMVGMATALAALPGLPHAWRERRDVTAPEVFVPWSNKAFAAAAASAIVKQQLTQLSRGRLRVSAAPAWRALLCDQIRTRALSRRYRRWAGLRTT